MKPNCLGFLLLLIFVSLISVSSVTARHITTYKRGEIDLKSSEIPLVSSPAEIKAESTHMGQDKGLEDCDGKDEECLNRRMIADAHLDYIYTQHQNP